MRSPWQLLCAIGRVIGAIGTGTYTELSEAKMSQELRAVDEKHFGGREYRVMSRKDAQAYVKEFNNVLNRHARQTVFPVRSVRQLWRGLPS